MTARMAAVPVAPVWSAPDLVRPADAPAVAPRPNFRAWTARLDDAARRDLHGRVETNVLLGDQIEVLAESDGWSQVVVPGQPSSKDERGYPGWMRTTHLTDPWFDAADVQVTAPLTHLHTQPDGPVVDSVSYATRLPWAGEKRGEWLAVQTPAGERWLPHSAVDGTAHTILAEARRFIGLPYLWAGVSGYGLDCSGLVHMVDRRLGRDLPRDAHDQAATAIPIPLDRVCPGDLYFFARNGNDIHHVGFVVQDGVMLDAPRTGECVHVHELDQDRRETLVGAGRLEMQ